MTVKELYAALEARIPRGLSCKWDNDGLMCCPDSDAPVRRVLVALDVTAEIAERAVAEGYDLILPSAGLQARSAFDNIVADRNLNLKVAIEANEVNTILNILKRSNYVTVLSETVILEHNGLVQVCIDDAECRMEGCLHFCTTRYRKRSTEEFIRLLSGTKALRITLL